MSSKPMNGSFLFSWNGTQYPDPIAASISAWEFRQDLIKQYNFSTLLTVEGRGNIYSTCSPRKLVVRFWETRGDLP